MDFCSIFNLFRVKHLIEKCWFSDKNKANVGYEDSTFDMDQSGRRTDLPMSEKHNLGKSEL